MIWSRIHKRALTGHLFVDRLLRKGKLLPVGSGESDGNVMSGGSLFRKMDRTVRFYLILALFGDLMLLPMTTYADVQPDCQTACLEEKTSREANDQANTDETDDARAEFLQASQEIYDSCLRDCQQSMPADPSPQTEN